MVDTQNGATGAPVTGHAEEELRNVLVCAAALDQQTEEGTAVVLDHLDRLKHVIRKVVKVKV